MKKIIIYSIYLSIFLFSFYLTNELAIIARNKDPIMQEILLKEDETIEAVNGIIEDDYIVPGISGKKINVNKSFNKMKQLGTYNENYLVYDIVLPAVSVSNNKEKIIKKGNTIKNEVTIITNNQNVLNYLNENNIKASSLEKFGDLEVINNSKYYDKKTSICLYEENIKEKCLKDKMIMIEPTYHINKSTLVTFRNKLSNGDIIFIDDNISTSELIYFINIINQKGLIISSISDLIRE